MMMMMINQIMILMMMILMILMMRMRWLISSEKGFYWGRLSNCKELQFRLTNG